MNKQAKPQKNQVQKFGDEQIYWGKFKELESRMETQNKKLDIFCELKI